MKTNKTYWDLYQILKNMSYEQLQDNISIHTAHDDEYHPVTDIFTNDGESDVIDNGHLYLNCE